MYPLLEDLKVKDCIYRFNKDIRFSKDKKPYKENFRGILAYWGKKSWNPCFYFHLQPGDKSFITWGVYFASPSNENKVRAHLLKHYDVWMGFLKDKKLMKYYQLDDAERKYKSTQKLKNLIARNPSLRKEISPAIMEYFSFGKEGKVGINWDDMENMLKYLAYYKDWGFTHHLSDNDVSSEHLFDEILDAYKMILPVIKFFDEAYDGPEYKS